MAVAENKLQDELLPEVELNVTPSKLSDNVRVDLCHLDDSFMSFLVTQGHIEDGVHNDVLFMSMTKFPKFCQIIRDTFRVYNMRENANV